MTLHRYHAGLFALFVCATGSLAPDQAAAQTAPPPAAPPAQAATAPAAASAPALIDTLIRDMLAILRDPNLHKDAKRAKVRDLASAQIDFDTLSRLTLGLHWRTLTADQRTQFVREFRQHLAATYGSTTDRYTDEDIVAAGDRQESNGDWSVNTRILGTRDGARKEIARVDYRLRKGTAGWKVIDVTIDGVSLMANFRAQFQDIMANGGYDRLIKALREKNAPGAK